MHIYYINLDHDVARRQGLEDQLRNCGLIAERIAALVPADIDAAIVAANCESSRNRYVTPGELACTLSHQRAWRRMLDAGLPHALFLEDDALLSKRLAEFLAASDPLPAGIDVLRIETNLPKVRLGRAESHIGRLSTVHSIHSLNYGAAGYVLTRSAAEMLLGGLCPLDLPVDMTLFSPRSHAFATLKVRQTIPAPIANGPAKDAIVASVIPSNLAAARRSRGEEITRRYQTTPHYRIWGSGLGRSVEQTYLRLRNGLRHAAARVFRGVRAYDIPLL